MLLVEFICSAIQMRLLRDIAESANLTHTQMYYIQNREQSKKGFRLTDGALQFFRGQSCLIWRLVLSCELFCLLSVMSKLCDGWGCHFVGCVCVCDWALFTG